MQTRTAHRANTTLLIWLWQRANLCDYQPEPCKIQAMAVMEVVLASWRFLAYMSCSIARPMLDVSYLKTGAAPSNQNPKPKSVICSDIDGNGAVLCSQCKGSGANSVDIFNGQFKAGDSCWFCGGKKDMLRGNCNGAGFVGGFFSTTDEQKVVARWRAE